MSNAMLNHETRVRCNLCKKVTVLKVNADDYHAFRWDGMFAQDAFPYLSVADRELLISSTCGPCFDELFGGDDD